MKNKIELRRRQAKIFAAAKILGAAASATKAYAALPDFMLGVMIASAMAAAQRAAGNIPVKVFRCDRPKIDPRRAKAFFRRQRLRMERGRVLHVRVRVGL